MKAYLPKFNEQYKGKQSIEIELFNEEPLTTKYARYNQSGEVCYCMADSTQANQKTKNGWQKVNCDTFKCQYRQRNEQGKCACNRIGWLKFIIPSVCKDRIFLMRITGQTSINRLDDYFNLQRAQGNSLKGRYTLFLKQEEQSNSLGKTFNNYVLDILKQEDFIFQNTIPENTEKPKELSTKNDQNVNNEVVNSNTTTSKVENIAEFKELPKEEITTKSKKATAKTTKSKAKKVEDIKKETEKQESKDNTENPYKDCYQLFETYNKEIAGRTYLIAKFVDMKDKIYDVAIRPDDALELEQCELGTAVRLKLQDIKGQLFAIKLEFVEKMLKKVAA